MAWMIKYDGQNITYINWPESQINNSPLEVSAGAMGLSWFLLVKKLVSLFQDSTL